MIEKSFTESLDIKNEKEDMKYNQHRNQQRNKTHQPKVFRRNKNTGIANQGNDKK